MVKLFFVSVLLLSLAGCNDQFRYPCQDPRNWEEPFCKKPMCSSNGTCPEDLHHYLKDKDKKAVPMNNNIGACK